MKNIIGSILILFAVSATAQLPVLEIGKSLPAGNIKMECATSGKTTDLSSLKGDNGLLVIFSCNTCPFVVAWEDRYQMIADWVKTNKVGYALVNSNFLKRGDDDSWEAMKAHSKKLNYKWPYLIDKESEVANAFGAQTTPHVSFLIKT
jgi:peroxiredoxin